MAQTSSPPARKPPTIAPLGAAKRAPVASAPDPAPPAASAGTGGWPAEVPPMQIALLIVSGQIDAPPELKEATQTFLSALSFAESAALHEPQPTADVEALCSVVASRWRLMSALALRPSGEIAPDPTALEELLQEVDATLASLGKLKESDDPDIQAACDAARKALAKDVHKLLPTTSGPGRGGDGSTDDLKQLRKALATASKSERQSAKGLRSVTSGKKMLVVVVAGVIAIASGAFTLVRALHDEQLPPLTALPEPPPNTELVGNPESGTVIVRSTNGKPLDGEALEKFKARAGSAGANVQLLGPTQALVTSAKTP